LCVAALGVASTVMSAVSSVQQGKAQAAAYKQQAEVSRQNALYQEAQAANAAYNGAQEEHAIRQKGKQIIGTQTAAFGASNIDTSSGSAADVINSSDYNNLMDALQARRNAANQSWADQVEATNYNNQAKNYDVAASNARKAGNLNAIGSVLTGATSLATQYSQYKSAAGTSAKSFLQW